MDSTVESCEFLRPTLSSHVCEVVLGLTQDQVVQDRALLHDTMMKSMLLTTRPEGTPFRLRPLGVGIILQIRFMRTSPLGESDTPQVIDLVTAQFSR